MGIYTWLLAPVIYLFTLYGAVFSVHHRAYVLSQYSKVLLLVSFLSIGGVPPLLGFVNKLFVIKLVVREAGLIMVFVAVMAAVCLLYFYILLVFSATSADVFLRPQESTKGLYILEGHVAVSSTIGGLIIISLY